MLTQIDGQYVVTIGKHAGDTLSWHLKHRRYYLHTTLCCMADSPNDVAIVTAALAVYGTDIDPDTREFWAAVDAVVAEKRVNDER